jgi:predicted nucleic acid-binding protein
MAILIDTNILLRLLQPHHPHCQIAERAIDALRARNEILNIVSQNIIELWAVVTRPVVHNGLGLTVEEATKELEQIKRLWVLVPDLPLFEEWEHLVKTYRVSGKNTHDARLVAAMHVHGISSILTFNRTDFDRYTGITVIDPMALS